MNTENTYWSRWDWVTWLLLLLLVACLLWGIKLSRSVVSIITTSLMFAIPLVEILSVHYKIAGDTLEVVQFLSRKRYPISKIAEITLSKHFIQGPAVAFRHRLEITFTDRSVLKSSLPLVISPRHQQQFIDRLKAINPSIKISEVDGTYS